jgi:S1-C subfamily serine protease
MPEDPRWESPRPPAWLGADAGMPPPPGYSPGPPVVARRKRIAFVVAAFLLVNSILGAWLLSQVANKTAGVHPATGRVETDAQVGALAAMVEPTIVDINTFAHRFGAPPHRTVPLGAGTGMILTPGGQILTNNHVVNGASKIEVVISGRSDTATAKVVGVDPTADVALLQLRGVSGLPAISPGESGDVSTGDRVLGIGNALGRGGAPTVVSGSITAIDVSIRAGDPGGSTESLAGMFQTDAQIQPGDSGGALVDAEGRVIGMITAGGTADKSKTGPVTGFAIPIEVALGIVDRIRSGEACCPIMLGVRGHLGIAVRALDAQTARKLGATDGVLVVGVDPDGPAQGAGMVAPSVIVSIAEQPTTSPQGLGTVLHAYVPGQQVPVTWIDATGTHTMTIRLGKGPAV